MDTFIINILVGLYFLYAWKISKNRDFLWGMVLALLVVVLSTVKLILNRINVVSPVWITTALHYSWLVILVAVGFFLFKTSKKK